ncbi:MAG: patatin-like phospholipase family protein [Acidobacteriota bacterium]
MPSAQSQFPLTLAEVLFEELENMYADIDDDQIEIEVVYAEVENRGLALIRAISSGSDWDEIEAGIDQIRDLPEHPRDQVEEAATTENLKLIDGEDLTSLIWRCKNQISVRLVPKLYEVIRNLPQKRSALCLSGGGVRSAVFNLGIIQGLARCGLLERFDYLSTVSGGGFIGGWLSAWIRRENRNVGTVANLLAKSPDNPGKPEPSPLYKLRIYANYLTPRKGLLSADTWTLVAIYLRNLLLNWMVFVPVIMAGLMLPRIWVALVKSSYGSSAFFAKVSPTVLLWIGFGAAVVALIYIGTNLPGAKRLNLPESRFVIFCLAPLAISAMALTTYWARLDEGPTPQRFIYFALLLGAIPWALYVVLSIISAMRKPKRGEGEVAIRQRGWPLTIVFYFVATILIAISFAGTAYLIWYVVTNFLPPPLNLQVGGARAYASLAVPVLLLLLTLGGTLISGLTSRFTDVDDQEWWARSGAWILIVMVGWTVFHVLVLFGPSLFVDLQTLVVGRKWDWTSLKATGASLKGVVAALVGIISGVITIFGGKSAKTSAHGEEKEGGGKQKILSLVMSLSAVIFGAFIAIILALVTNWIIASSFGEWAGNALGSNPLNQNNPLDANDPLSIIYKTPGRLLVALTILIALAGVILGRFINTNRFSLHYYWRNRMMRAYLGVSRHTPDREKTRYKFTDFDVKDNVQMYELKQKPLHVVNVTLNLAGGEKVEWQDRKAESFSISPLHSGSYWLGYRNSRYYGGADGISLATSVAISGAAASPNMGYMMSSPVIRFIMALFNVRLGFWLGNPGVAGSGDSSTFNQTTYDRDSPTQSVRPIFAEALGKTNDKSPYVYLSDGGHFDNFGLYEMVLRRCRFIIVSDASTDPDYCYESLAYAIRQVRVDFGVPIEMSQMSFNRNPDKANRYCAVGKIRYSCVDNHGPAEDDPKYDGTLIYIKPSLNGGEPADVLNFHESDSAFPQDTIVDQWFGEAQFESYRMLGSHMVTKICPQPIGDSPGYFEKFVELATAHQELK